MAPRIGAGIPARALVCLALSLIGLYRSTPAAAATLYVNPGDSLQAVLDMARPGDEIIITAGARFVGMFVLPPKPAGATIMIRSSATLPARRITPADAALLPTLVSSTGLSALSGTGTANWSLDGIRFESNVNGEGNVLQLQDATNIRMDRLLIVGGTQGQKRGIMANGRQITVTRSYIANMWRYNQDSQAFAAWDGAGPYTITDNYFEAASENILFGGADSASAANIPADILVEGNHLSKRWEWKGQGKSVKNLLELKSARRVVIRNNLFERNWADGQSGYAILFTPRNQGGTAPWSVIEDVIFEQNIIRDTDAGLSVLGYDDLSPSGQTTRVTVRNNLFVASGIFLLIGGEAGTVTIDHNTINQGHNFATAYKGAIWPAGQSKRAAAVAADNLIITNNIAKHNDYGFIGQDMGIGTASIIGMTRARTWTHNVLAGEKGWGLSYPPITWQPSMAEHAAQLNADYTLPLGSPYRSAATDGTNLGRVAGAPVTVPVEPPPTPAPTPTPPPPPPPPPAVDTTAPVVTLKVVQQNRKFVKYRVEATDAGGIASVVVSLDGKVIQTATAVPVDFSITLASLTPGAHPITVTVTDTAGNATTVTTSVTR